MQWYSRGSDVQPHTAGDIGSAATLDPGRRSIDNHQSIINHRRPSTLNVKFKLKALDWRWISVFSFMFYKKFAVSLADPFTILGR
jgi:hypothetical protein